MATKIQHGSLSAPNLIIQTKFETPQHPITILKKEPFDNLRRDFDKLNLGIRQVNAYKHQTVDGGKITAMIPLQEGFVTGTHTGRLRIWDGNFNLKKAAYCTVMEKSSNAITALHPIKDGTFVSTTNSGIINHWSAKGNLSTPIDEMVISESLTSPRFITHFTAIVPVPERDDEYLTGATSLTLWRETSGINHVKSLRISDKRISDLRLLNDHSVLVAFKYHLALIKIQQVTRDESKFHRSGLKYTQIETPPTILAHLTKEEGQINGLESLGFDKVGVACSRGLVKIFDLNKSNMPRAINTDSSSTKGLLKFSASTFATYGKEGTVQFWDTRTTKAVAKTSPLADEITGLVRFNSTSLVASTYEGSQSTLQFLDTKALY